MRLHQEKVVGVVALLDRRETIPRRAWIRGADTLLALVAQEVHVGAVVAVVHRRLELIDPRLPSGMILRSLVVEVHEDGEDPVRAAAAARKMARAPRTIAAVGPFTSLAAGQTIPITNRAGLLECSPANSYAGLTKPEFGALDVRAAHPKRIN